MCVGPMLGFDYAQPILVNKSGGFWQGKPKPP